MTGASDDEKFGRLLEALGPYLERVVIVGGCRQAESSTCAQWDSLAS